MGAHSPAGRGRGFPPGPHARGGCPLPFLLPSRGVQVFLLRPKGGGDSLLQASPPVPLSPTPPRPDAGAGRQLWARSLLPPQCLVSPGPLRPPCCGRVRAPGVGGAEMLSLRLRGLHGRILFPRCHWATWREGREDGGRTFSPRLGQPPCPRRHSVITGKENCFKKLPC